MTTDTDLLARVARLEDRAEIRECMMRYARGMDRRDRDVLRSAYHDGAIDDHVGFTGDVDDFTACVAEWITESSSSITDEVIGMLSAHQVPTKDRTDPSYRRPLVVAVQAGP